MFSTSDTIVAVATPPGRGAIGVVRLSGADAGAILRTLTGRDTFDARHATLATVAGIDRAIVTRFPAPHSYTGEDVVEISAHGSPVVLRTIVEAAIAGGARLAEPGEFTLRAYLAGRLDLPQAEAVADLVDAVTPLQARAAFDQLDGTLSERIAAHDAALFDLIARLEASVDFPDEGYHFVEPCRIAGELDALIAGLDGLIADGTRGRLVREGLQAVIAGKPNVGKSSLFNALAGAARAIVTPIPGTTRDLVTEVVDVNGVRATLVDTAGQRAAADPIEAQGVARARGAGAIADLVLVVVDASAPLDADDRAVLDATAGRRRLIVMNKIDLGRDTSGEGRLQPDRVISVSALTGAGLDDLRAALADALDAEPRRDTPAITNVRHVTLVTRAREALARARAAAAGATGALPEEFVLADLQDARAAFEEITGRRTPDDVLAHIFERFCVGK